MHIFINTFNRGILLLSLLTTPVFSDSWILPDGMAESESASSSAEVMMQQDFGDKLQAVNVLITGDSESTVPLIQTFNADGIEMIQNNASHSFQALNYIGIR